VKQVLTHLASIEELYAFYILQADVLKLQVQWHFL